MSRDFQVGPDTFVGLEYAVFDADGDAVASGPSHLEFVFGRGQLLPALERALDGLSQGDRRTVTLQARDAYGRRDPRAVLEVDRAEFPEDVAPGDRFEVENEQGAVLVLQVLDVGPDTVHLDLNHPLAGQDIRIDLTVTEVRPATTAELDAAERALEEAAEPAASRLSEPMPLIPLESLLRGPGRGYEKGPAGDN
jgi:FKBP-type peptidyl-prolyl cis-trans isomerase SlyD